MTTYTLTHAQVTWVNIVGTTEEDLAELARLYPQFHPLNLHDCLAQLEYPKVDHHDDYLFLIMHFPVFEKRQRLSLANEVDIFVASGLLVTAHQGQLKPLVELFDACTQDPAAREQYMGHGASPLMHVVIDRLVNYCFPIVAKVDSQIYHIEENLFADRPRHILEEIAVVRRDLIALRRIIRPQHDVLCALENPFVRLEALCAARLMSAPVKTVSEVDTLCGLFKIMAIEGFRQMPLVDDDDRATRVISMWQGIGLLAHSQ